jgi:hypothetical protein
MMMPVFYHCAAAATDKKFSTFIVVIKLVFSMKTSKEK